MDERISCTVDELAEALAAHLIISNPGQLARQLASYLKADRLPEPEPPDGTPIEEIEWWEE